LLSSRHLPADERKGKQKGQTRSLSLVSKINSENNRKFSHSVDLEIGRESKSTTVKDMKKSNKTKIETKIRDRD
jgi:hypothetical protein